MKHTTPPRDKGQAAAAPQVKEYAGNAKRHPRRQLERIAASIRELGFDQPIVVDAEGTIIVGHGRYLAATRILKWKDVRFGATAARKGEAFIPVVMRDDLTGDEVRARRLNDNKLNESEWDMDLVHSELKLLPAQMVDLAGFALVADMKVEFPQLSDADAPRTNQITFTFTKAKDRDAVLSRAAGHAGHKTKGDALACILLKGGC